MADINRVLYWVLVVGMVCSTSLFISGMVAFAVPTLQTYSEPLLTVAALVLLATPVTRTFIGTATFALNREKKSAIVAGIVFSVLLLSMALGYFLKI